MIVFTNGCFDIIHVGHIDYLEKSKALGNKLIVGLNSDRSVTKLKGPSRPVNNELNRKRVLESLKCVDEVIIFDEDDPYELIKKIKPDILTKASDYAESEVVGRDLVPNLVLIPYINNYSTTNIIDKIKNEK